MSKSKYKFKVHILAEQAITLKTISVFGRVKFSEENGLSYPEELQIPPWLEVLSVSEIRKLFNHIGKVHLPYTKQFKGGLEKTYIFSVQINLVEDKTTGDKLDGTARPNLN